MCKIQHNIEGCGGLVLRRNITILAGTLLSCSQTVWAGAWPSEKGHGQIIQTLLTDTAKMAYDNNGNLTLPVKFSKLEETLFWEHSVKDNLTLVLNSSYQNLNFTAGADNVQFSGFGETSVGIRHALFHGKKSVVSLQANVIFAVPGETVSDADLGIGSTQYESRMLIGRSFKIKQKDGFVDMQAAWRMRPGDVPDEWRVDATVGWRPMSNIQVLAQSFYASGKERIDVSRTNERLKVQGSIVFDKNTKTSYQIGMYSTITGKTIIKEKAFFIGVWQRY